MKRASPVSYAIKPWTAARPEVVPAREAGVGVVARARLPSLVSVKGRRAFVRLRLWCSAGHLWRARPGHDDCQGLFEPRPKRISYADGIEMLVLERCLGDLHLAADCLRLEIIAHEVGHALVQRLDILGPVAEDILDQRHTGQPGKGPQVKFHGGRADEEFCYELGYWVAAVHAWAVAAVSGAATRS